jgi:hypothetical protein
MNKRIPNRKENEPLTLNAGDKVVLPEDKNNGEIVMTITDTGKPEQVAEIGKLVLKKCTYTLKPAVPDKT